MTIAEASRKLAERKISPVELAKAHLERIDQLDPALSAFVTVTPERALADARESEERIMRSGPKTPLDGIPIAHKDVFCTAGIRTTAHSRLLQDNIPQADATVVTKLASAGTVMLGKLATLEFALTGPSFDLPWPPARNPWNLDHFTSGSSSGTAAAVAAGLVLGGTGSDTGGSIRGPAAACGVTGLKPTYGRCSRAGVIPLAHTLDHTGPMAWTAADCALLLQQMAGFDPDDPASARESVPDFSAELGRSVRGLRIGVVRHFHEVDKPVAPAVAKGIETSIEILRSQGALIRDVTLSPLKAYSAANRVIVHSEALAVHEHWMRTRPGDYGRRLRNRLLLASTLTAADYIQAQRRRRELCREMAAAMTDVDILLTAAAADEAPLMTDISLWDGLLSANFSSPWSQSGYPAMTVCSGFGESGLPIGVQLGGRPFAEATLLRVAHILESETHWRNVRPALANPVPAAPPLPVAPPRPL